MTHDPLSALIPPQSNGFFRVSCQISTGFCENQSSCLCVILLTNRQTSKQRGNTTCLVEVPGLHGHTIRMAGRQAAGKALSALLNSEDVDYNNFTIAHASSPATGYLRGGYNFDATATVQPPATFMRVPVETCNSHSRAVAVASHGCIKRRRLQLQFDFDSISIRLRLNRTTTIRRPTLRPGLCSYTT